MEQRQRIQLFLSTVSAEFKSYREALRHDFDRPNVTVKAQEDFIVSGTPTFDMLDTYIQQCDGVIHLVGDMTGALAKPKSVEVITERYPDQLQKLPIGEFLRPGGPSLSYTQSENGELISGGRDGSLLSIRLIPAWRELLPQACRRLEAHPRLQDWAWLNTARATCHHFVWRYRAVQPIKAGGFGKDSTY